MNKLNYILTLLFPTILIFHFGYGQSKIIEFKESELILVHESCEELLFNKTDKYNLYNNIEQLVKNISSMWVLSNIETNDNEYYNRSIKEIKNQDIQITIDGKNKILELNINGEAYFIKHKNIQFKVGNSISDLIEKLNHYRIDHTPRNKYNFIEIPFTYKNKIKGLTKIVSGNRSLLIYFENNFIVSLRITEWD